MLHDLLVSNLWIGLTLWVITYAADYYLTVLSAKLYEQIGRQFVATEGSLELTPEYEQDIEARRLLSPRFLKSTAFGCIFLLGIWYVAVFIPVVKLYYMFILGALVLRQLAVIIRHVNNLTMYGLLRKEGAATGKIEYRRWVAHRRAGVDLIAFGCLFLFSFAMTGQLFWAGGSLFCAATGAEHFKKGRQIA